MNFRHFNQFFFLGFFCLISQFLKAQSGGHYIFQQDDERIKEKYFAISENGNQELVNTLKGKHQSMYKSIYAERLDQVKEFLLSPRSVTAAPAYDYLQSVVDRMLAGSPEWKNKSPRLLFSRDWWPNAFSMGEGTIVINAGLFVHLNSESELAFVVGHELAHYFLDHGNQSITKYIESVSSESFQAELKKLSQEEYGVNSRLEKLAMSMALDNRRHSREHESEADMLAIQLLEKAGYATSAAISCLRLLDKSDSLTLYSPLMLTEVLSFEKYPFKPRWIQKESALFSRLKEDADSLTLQQRDSLKTHPDCDIRINKLQSFISASNHSHFLVNESVFRKLKNDFSLEIMEAAYQTGNISRSLYYALQAIQKDQHSSEAAYIMIRNLDDIYTRQSEHRVGNNLDRENKQYPEDYNLLLRWLTRVRLQELAEINHQLCLRYFGVLQYYPGFQTLFEKAKKRVAQ